MFCRKIMRGFNFYCSVLYSTFLKKESLARIEEIDVFKKEFIVHLRGVRSPINFGFDELLKDDDILSSFSPIQASYIGYYYGMYSYNYLNNSKYPNIQFDYFKYEEKEKHTILMMDRVGNLVYFDPISGVQNTKSPLEIMLDKNLIKAFPPLQSCYIGILSGITKAKINKQLSRTNFNDNKLKLVL